MKKNKKILLDFIICLVIFISTLLIYLKLPYRINISGGIIDVGDRISINKAIYSGSLNMTYVRSLNATPITYFIAKIKPDWDIESNKKTNGTSTKKEADFKAEIGKNNSEDCAIITAFNHSKKIYKIKSKKIYTTYIFKEAKTNLKVGDTINKIDGIKINSREDIKKYINSKKEGDLISIEVTNNNKQFYRKAKIIEIDQKPYIGAIFDIDYELSYTPQISFEFEENEKGASGGLMLALAIYSKINNIDITNNLKIAGTGTINENGIVGEISGIKYKLKGAVKNKMDIFLCPKENYKEAIEEKKKNNYKIKIYGVSTFDDALEVLKKLEK